MSMSSTRAGQSSGGGSHANAHGPHAHDVSHHDAHHQDDERRPSRWRDREHPPPPRRYSFRRHRSGVVEWAAAVLFTVLAVAVLVGAVSILVVVLLLQPRAPYVAVRAATLDALQYDQQGALEDVQLSLRVEARNDNAHSAASFSRLECRLSFAGRTLAVLRADPFRVPARAGLPLAYVARAQGAPLGDAGSAAMEAALRDAVVPFGVEGEARTRWKVAGLVAVDHWTRLACQLRFVWPPNGTTLPNRCSSKSKFLFF